MLAVDCAVVILFFLNTVTRIQIKHGQTEEAVQNDLLFPNRSWVLYYSLLQKLQFHLNLVHFCDKYVFLYIHTNELHKE